MPPLGLGDKLIFNNLDKVALNLHDRCKFKKTFFTKKTPKIPITKNVKSEVMPIYWFRYLQTPVGVTLPQLRVFRRS